MRLNHITFTGIDANTDIQELIDIQREYPIAEFGVLTSYHWYENGNRYLNPAFLSNLYAGNGKLNLALHVCGSAAADAAWGYWDKVDELTIHTLPLFKRIQLNIGNRSDLPYHIQTKGLPYEVIIQQRSCETDLYMRSKRANDNKNVSMLIDDSGGQGKEIKLRVLITDGKIGYAGGLCESNVAANLDYLLRTDNAGDFWIDMESGVRTDDWFDTGKVRRVLATCKEVIKDFGMEE